MKVQEMTTSTPENTDPSGIIAIQRTVNEHAIKFILPSRILSAMAEDVPVVYTLQDKALLSSSAMAQRLVECPGIVSAQFGFDSERQYDYVAVTKSPENPWETLARHVADAINASLQDAPVNLDLLARERQRAEEIRKQSFAFDDPDDLEGYMRILVADAYQNSVAKHNGSLEYVGYNPEQKALLVKFAGTCSSCSSLETVSMRGLSQFFKNNVPDLQDVVDNVVDVGSDPHAAIYMGQEKAAFRLVPVFDRAALPVEQQAALAAALQNPHEPYAIQDMSALQQAVLSAFRNAPDAHYINAGKSVQDGYMVDFWDHPSLDPAKAVAFLYDEKKYAPEKGSVPVPHIFTGKNADVAIAYNMSCDNEFNFAAIDSASGYKVFREGKRNFPAYVDRHNMTRMKKGVSHVVTPFEQINELRMHVLKIDHVCGIAGPGLRYKGNKATGESSTPSQPRFEAKPV